jgi:hypothetical protein
MADLSPTEIECLLLETVEAYRNLIQAVADRVKAPFAE